jgi:hypothetical protein
VGVPGEVAVPTGVALGAPVVEGVAVMLPVLVGAAGEGEGVDVPPGVREPVSEVAGETEGAGALVAV